MTKKVNIKVSSLTNISSVYKNRIAIKTLQSIQILYVKEL